MKYAQCIYIDVVMYHFFQPVHKNPLKPSNQSTLANIGITSCTRRLRLRARKRESSKASGSLH